MALLRFFIVAPLARCDGPGADQTNVTPMLRERHHEEPAQGGVAHDDLAPLRQRMARVIVDPGERTLKSRGGPLEGDTVVLQVGSGLRRIPFERRCRRRKAHNSEISRERRATDLTTARSSLHLVVRQPKYGSPDYFLLPGPPAVARFRIGVDRRARVVAFRTARRASCTASDVGKAFATSGWSATSVVPFNRWAYLPRRPGPNEARSYSGRRSWGLLRLA